MTDPFEQAFFLLVHIPYLQSFDDINTRTSRVASNIQLLKAQLALTSFLTMDDGDYMDGLVGIHELNNVALLRDAFMDADTASAKNDRVLRAELEVSEKAALVDRGLAREAVRRSVLDRKAFDPALVTAMAAEAGIPEEDCAQVVRYVGRQIHGLHEGNAIRFGLRPADLETMAEHTVGSLGPRGRR